MKAPLARAFDSADGLKLEDLAAPGAPGADEVLVQLRAASVNPLDLKLLSGVMQSVFAIRLPYILGTDIAGVVEQTGELVTRFSPGDRVVGRLLPTRGGGFCEKVLAPAHALTLIADDLNYEEAAAIPTAAGTAWLCLFDIGKVRAGQRVLTHAGGGGVGGFATYASNRIKVRHGRRWR